MNGKGVNNEVTVDRRECKKKKKVLHQPQINKDKGKTMMMLRSSETIHYRRKTPDYGSQYIHTPILSRDVLCRSASGLKNRLLLPWI